MQRASDDSSHTIDHQHDGELNPEQDVSTRRPSAEQKLTACLSAAPPAVLSGMPDQAVVARAASFKKSFVVETTVRARSREDRELISLERGETKNASDSDMKLVSHKSGTTIQAISRPPKWGIKWSCGVCSNACIPVRSESRCLWYKFVISKC